MNKLTAKVKAVNLANEWAANVYASLTKAFAPFVGQQVLKATGEVMARVQKHLPALPNTNKITVYKSSSNYNLCYVVKTCVCYGESSCFYHETNVFIGDLHNGTLTKLLDYPTGLRTNWTEQEVLEGRVKIKEARHALTSAEAAVSPFGEYDH